MFGRRSVAALSIRHPFCTDCFVAKTQRRSLTRNYKMRRDMRRHPYVTLRLRVSRLRNQSRAALYIPISPVVGRVPIGNFLLISSSSAAHAVTWIERVSRHFFHVDTKFRALVPRAVANGASRVIFYVRSLALPNHERSLYACYLHRSTSEREIFYDCR